MGRSNSSITTSSPESELNGWITAYIWSFLLFFFISSVAQAVERFDSVSVSNSVAIGTTSANSKALLDASSTSKGVLLPRMSNGQLTNINTPPEGLLAYDNTNHVLQFFNGTSWLKFLVSGGSGTGSLLDTDWTSSNIASVNGSTFSSILVRPDAASGQAMFAVADVTDTVTTPIWLYIQGSSTMNASNPNGGGALVINGGEDHGAAGGGGAVLISGGQSDVGGSGGALDLSGGNAIGGGRGGQVLVAGGSGSPAGNVVIEPGSSSAKLRFQNVNEGSAGYFWKSTDTLGSGQWSNDGYTLTNINAASNLTGLVPWSQIPQTDSISGASSAPALKFSGSPYTAGNATTNKPLIDIEDSSTSNGWSTAGTYLGVNVKNSFGGRLADFQKNGISQFALDYNGYVTTNFIQLGSGGGSGGQLYFYGSNSGAISVLPQSDAGNYNFNLPTTAGSSGNVLTSAGGASSPMTWTAATNANTASAIVKRDGSGNFSAGTVSATFSGDGNALTNLNATQLLTGTVPAARLPNPSSSTLGGVESYASVSHQWINTISTSGVPSSSQPAFSDISGQVTWAQIPQTDSTAGAAGTPALSFTGAPITGVGTTSSKPLIMIETSGATSNNWSTSGTMLGVNAAATFTGRLLTLQTNATEEFGVSAGGIVTVADHINVGGSTSGVTGAVNVQGSTAGSVSIKPQANFTNYEFDLPTSAGNAGQVLISQGGAGTAMTWGAINATQIQSVAVGSTSPTASQMLIFNGSTSQWEPHSLSSDASVVASGAVTVSKIQGNSIKSGTPSDSQVLIWNNSDTTWEPKSVGGDVSTTNSGSFTVSKIQGASVSSTGPSDTQLLIWNNSNTKWEPKTLGSDVSITNAGSATVAAIQGKSVSSNSPTDSQILIWNNSNSKWEPKSVGGDVSTTNAGASTVAKIQGNSVKSGAPSDTQILIWNNSNTTWEPKTVSSDATMTNSGAVTVAKLQGVSVSTTSPTSSQVLTFNSGNSKWEPTTSAALTNPMTTGGDIIYGGASGAATRLANGNSGQYLKSAGGTSAPAWTSFTAHSVTTETSTGTQTGTHFVVSGVTTAPTNGATYTNNAHTWTVIQSSSDKTQIYASCGTCTTSGTTLAKSAGTGDTSITFSTTTSLASYTPPSTAKALWVRLVGGGGGGGGGGTAASSSSAGGGGGGGGYSEKLITSFDSTIYYEVGTAGSAGSAGANNGGAGGQTTLVDSHFILAGLGGALGNGSNATSTGFPQNAAAPGIGGTASGGDLNIQGGSGSASQMNSVSNVTGSYGGATPLGSNSGYQLNASGAGSTGRGYGGGGGGGVSINSGGTQAGGAGAAGVIDIIELYNGN